MMVEFIMHLDDNSYQNYLKKNLNDISKNMRSILRESSYIQNGAKFK